MAALNKVPKRKAAPKNRALAKARAKGGRSSSGGPGAGQADDNPDASTDPLDAIVGHSTPLRPLFDVTAPGTTQPYISPNVAKVLRGADIRSARGGRGNEISAADLLAASFVLPSIHERGWTQMLTSPLISLGAPPDSLFPLSAQEQWRAAGDEPSPKSAAVLRWDSVALLSQASALRRETNIVHASIGLRHLCFAALFLREGQEALNELGLLKSGLQSFAEPLCKAIQSSANSPRRYGDDMKAWEEVIERARKQRLLIAPRSRSGFLADTIEEDKPGADGAAASDPLGTRADAQALADLILLESARPPLAIGLFGSWGSGKSTLMHRLRQEVKRQTQEEREAKGSTESDPETRRVRNVAQLEFNAWSFADSKNLWASLTAEIFDQLKAGGGQAMLQQRGERLVCEVAKKLAHEETTAADGPSPASLQAELEGLEANALQKKLAAEVAPVTIIPDFVSAGGEAAKRRLDRVFRDGRDRVALETRKSLISKSWWLARRMYPGWLRAAFLIALAAFVAAVVTLLLVPPPAGFWLPLAAIAAPLVAGVGVAGRPIARALRAALRYDELLEIRRAELAHEAAGIEATIAEKKAKLEKARREAAKRAAAISTLAETKGHPARLLQYLLSDSADIQSIRAQVGLLATVRRCFETLNDLIRRHHQQALQDVTKGLHEPEPIDRIILYIDDLDRCSAEQVFKVLEAVHLLLAFECFIVVVAIDARWLRRSLVLSHPQFHPTEGEEDEEYGRPSPTDYLEKIFQIPFWVRPIAPASAADSGAYGRFLDHLIGSSEVSTPAPSGATLEAGGIARGASKTGLKRVPPPAPPEQARERVERVKISTKEQELLKKLGPLAAKSPRAIKRLVNIYRLIRAGLSHDQQAVFLEAGTAETPSFRHVLFVLALDAGIAAASLDDLKQAIDGLDADVWKKLAAKPELLRNAELAPDSNSEARPGGLASLARPLSEAGRLDKFVSALETLKESHPSALDKQAIQRAFAFTQRYSFRGR